MSASDEELLDVAEDAARAAAALLVERFTSGIGKEIRSKSTPTDLVRTAPPANAPEPDEPSAPQPAAPAARRR